MNSFWLRAFNCGVLDSIYGILKIELQQEEDRKSAEIAKFDSLRDDPVGLDNYKNASGLNRDVCERILSEVKRDFQTIQQHMGVLEKSAVYGEKTLGLLFSADGKRKWKKNTSGCNPVDIVIVRQENPSALMGDCKFGLKSADAGLFWKKEQYDREFARKFLSVGGFLVEHDGIIASEKMLLIVTSSLAPLLINRFEDFKLDPQCADIPYDKIVVCSVDDIISASKDLLP